MRRSGGQTDHTLTTGIRGGPRTGRDRRRRAAGGLDRPARRHRHQTPARSEARRRASHSRSTSSTSWARDIDKGRRDRRHGRARARRPVEPIGGIEAEDDRRESSAGADIFVVPERERPRGPGARATAWRSCRSRTSTRRCEDLSWRSGASPADRRRAVAQGTDRRATTRRRLPRRARARRDGATPSWISSSEEKLNASRADSSPAFAGEEIACP